MAHALVVEPVFAARVWGGDSLRAWYGEAVPKGTTIGECWAISGMPGSAGRISHGAPEGYTLADAWATGLVTGAPRTDDFPLLCKLLDTRDWLSVQVHPNDQQALELEGEPRGKSECWLVLQADPGAELIVGHSAATAAELATSIADGTMFSQLIRRQVSPGSFFMVPAGCVHAIGPGLLVYEVQQSSDTTYRLYDFNRLGLDGRPRELHVQKSFAVMRIPHDPTASLTAAAPELTPWGSRQELVSNEQFQVVRHAIAATMPLESESFQLITIVSGSGELRTPAEVLPVARGTSIVIPTGARGVTIGGNLAMVVSEPGPQTPH
jgi:mannose-6-phosphate isomerase